MWYTESFNASIQVIKNAKKQLTEKEYNKIAKEQNLLSFDSLKCITGKKYKELSKIVRSQRE